MALVRFIFHSSILASAIFTSFLLYINPAHAEVACIVTDDDKSTCGKVISIPRVCIAGDDGKPICGKFTKVKKEGESSTRPTGKPFQNPGDGNSAYTKKINGFSFSLNRCTKSDVSGPLIICLFSLQNNESKNHRKVFTLRTRASNFVDFDGKSYPGQRSSFGRWDSTGGVDSKSEGDNVSISIDSTYYTGSIIFRVPEKMDLDRVPLLNVSTSLGVFQFWNLSQLKER